MRMIDKRHIYKYILVLLLLLPILAHSAAGVLIPTRQSKKTVESILSMEKMDVYIDLNNQYADVKIIQIYKNHTGNQIEGKYIFTMPDGATIADFAIWDDLVRIPSVVMEKQRARDIYEQITRRDPGLLEMTDVKSVVNKFSCRVFPIKAYGTKRIEMNYKQNLSINDLKTYFQLPLKPELYGEQKVKDFYLHLTVRSQYPIKDFKITAGSLPIKIEATENQLTGALSLKDFTLKEDFVFTYATEVDGIFTNILTHRDVKRVYKDISPANGKNYQDDSGYFLIKAIFDLPKKTAGGGRNIIIVFDTSLSMLFDKLDRAYESLNYFLDNLDGADRFNLLVFNDDVHVFSEKMLEANAKNIQAAKDFIDSGYIAGGTDIMKPFAKSFEAFGESDENYVIFISDGYPTIDDLNLKRLKERIEKMNNKNVKIFPFGIGDDTNKYFMQELAKENDGAFHFVASTETQMIQQEMFFNKIGSRFVEGLTLAYSPGNVYDVYPTEPLNTFNRTSIDYIGKYTVAGDASFKLQGIYNDDSISRDMTYAFPELNVVNAHIRRLWAEKRVDYLLKKIRFEGEEKEWITEIIALAKQFKFVTPYTSFLAAPRSILRPRVIKPGDPVLKVKADENITEVVAIFPFGLTKKMAYIEEKGIFMARFLVPSDVKDGEYSCRLLLKDNAGNVYKEKKTYVVDNSPPVIKVVIPKEVLPGDIVKVMVYADSDTKLLNAKFPYSRLVRLKYDANEKASIGYLKIDDKIDAGSYNLKITATDFAHNSSTKEIVIRVRSL